MSHNVRVLKASLIESIQIFLLCMVHREDSYGALEPLTQCTIIQWNRSTLEDTIGTQLAVLYTVELLYIKGHHWDPAGCPVYSGTSL